MQSAHPRLILSVITLAFGLAFGLGPAFADSAVARPGDDEVRVFQELYKVSPLRKIAYATEVDPDEVVREEIYLNRVLSARYRPDADPEDNRHLQADVDFYQTQWMLDYWLQNVLTVPTEPTEEEVAAYYEAHRDEYLAPATATFDHVFILLREGAPANEMEAADERALKALALLRRGVSFDKVAAEYSDAPGAKENKGRVGPLPLKRLMSELGDVLETMKPGDVSDLIRTPFGYEIVRLEELVPETAQPLEAVRPMIVQQIMSERLAPMQQAEMERVEAEFPAVVHDDGIQPGEPVDGEAVLVEVAGQSYTANEVLLSIWATHQFEKITDDAERLLAGLPRFVTTRQVLEDCRVKGLPETEKAKLVYRLIRERLLAERMVKTWQTERTPTEAELRAHYEERKDLFATLPAVNGTLYTWQTPGWETMTPSMIEFHREDFRRAIVEAMRGYIVDGQPRETVTQTATLQTPLEWAEPGPNGFRADEAIFAAKPGTFSALFNTSGGIGIAWIDERRDPVVPPFEEVRADVERSWRSQTSRAERARLVEETLAAYAEIP
ncbi:MAG: peptidyl-prolyl cis-trans isomerase [Candidatus Sumerlaeota bacterium]|nr:peptidyl-prolyl cis-trans isomerase [Candidatus Sumerlaeota bacterium]